MWVLMKQQGVTIQPWREDVKLGAVRDGDTVKLVLTTDRPWQGRLVFDQPRHKRVMHMPLDYPRINQFPEWFTIDSAGRLSIEMGNKRQVHTGKELITGLTVTLNAGQTERLSVTKID